ncbi:MAG: SDR family NAD(P)-dependent oxidoreductase [Deltaproteobacteria bacterium]|nr:SDR family NAD(P)-dependent oxidoreductase [Deltaproteobacteria bacterium]
MAGELLGGRVCLITGSSRGIGLGIARVFADNGAIVTLHGRDKATLSQSLASLPESFKHDYIAADLSTLEGSKKLAERLIRLNEKLDVLVHCAGILGPKTPLAAYPHKDWDEVIWVNLTVPFILTQEILPMLRKGDRPSIIFISSGVGRLGRAEWGAYAVSKFGVEGLTQVWAQELRGENIRVNAVNPGGTRTQMRAAAYPEEDPMILPTPEDIAPVFVWLARADTEINGQSLEARDWIGRDPAT